VSFLKKYYQISFFILFFLFIFLITSFNIIGTDGYIHFTSGEVIAHQGIIHHDALSQAGSDRQWIPAEWLFQLAFYWFLTLFGFASFRVFVGILSVVQVAALYILLRRTVRVNVMFSLGLSLLYVLFVYGFLIARPQIVATTLLIAELYILLLYVLKNKNVLYLLLPLTYLWANLHPSVIFSPFFCFAYFVVCLVYSYSNKKEESKWLKKARTLGLYVLGTGIVSVLPPQGFMQYQDLLLPLQYRDLTTHFIVEWQPLMAFLPEFIFYSGLVCITLCAFFFVIIKKKSITQAAWLLPLLFFIFYGYTAFRNTYYGYLTLIVLIGWLIAQLHFRHISNSVKILFWIGVLAVFGYEAWKVPQLLKANAMEYPDNAADFISEQNIQGNMFNQFNYGGFLEYRLYPTHKVFIDGRADVFLCCEEPDYFYLQNTLLGIQMNNTTLSNTDAPRLLTSFFEKYHITYVVLVMQKDDQFSQIISNILINDPKWNIVFWDDRSELFVKNDGKNTKLLTRFGANAVDPFGDAPVKKGLEQQAYNEYLRMVKTQDSAISRTQIGFGLELQLKQVEAAQQFERAIQLNKSYALAYAGLASVRAFQGQPQTAIELYKKAISLDPNLTIIYLRLAQLYYALHDTQNTRDILNQGITHATNDADRQFFQKKLQSL
jgi:tetratricopeptide (TPR) repeat protein